MLEQAEQQPYAPLEEEPQLPAEQVPPVVDFVQLMIAPQPAPIIHELPPPAPDVEQHPHRSCRLKKTLANLTPVQRAQAVLK